MILGCDDPRKNYSNMNDASIELVMFSCFRHSVDVHATTIIELIPVYIATPTLFNICMTTPHLLLLLLLYTWYCCTGTWYHNIKSAGRWG